MLSSFDSSRIVHGMIPFWIMLIYESNIDERGRRESWHSYIYPSFCDENRTLPAEEKKESSHVYFSNVHSFLWLPVSWAVIMTCNHVSILLANFNSGKNSHSTVKNFIWCSWRVQNQQVWKDKRKTSRTENRVDVWMWLMTDVTLLIKLQFIENISPPGFLVGRVLFPSDLQRTPHLGRKSDRLLLELLRSYENLP